MRSTSSLRAPFLWLAWTKQVELKAGEALDMEMIIGEVPGGAFCSYLLVEVDGVDYERNRQGAPILPVFKTGELSRDYLDMIYRYSDLPNLHHLPFLIQVHFFLLPSHSRL